MRGCIHEVPVYDGRYKVWRVLNVTTGTVYSEEHQSEYLASQSIEAGQPRNGHVVLRHALSEINGLLDAMGSHGQAYEEGYVHGLREYAHWKDGEQYVGTAGVTLKAAIAEFLAERGATPAQPQQPTPPGAGGGEAVS